MYPLKKIDSLGREIRTDFSSTEKVIRRFWGDTNKIKVRYHIYNQDVKFDVYDINGRLILSNETGNLKLDIPGFKISNQQSHFKVLPIFIKKWSELLKQNTTNERKS